MVPQFKKTTVGDLAQEAECLPSSDNGCVDSQHCAYLSSQHSGGGTRKVRRYRPSLATHAEYEASLGYKRPRLKIFKSLNVFSSKLKKKKVPIKIQLGFDMKNVNVPREFQLSNHV